MTHARDTLIFAAAVAALAACGPAPADAPFDGLVIPPSPQEIVTLWAEASTVERVGADRARVVLADTPLAIGLGDGYPERVELRPEQLYGADCRWNGKWTITDGNSSDARVARVEVDSDGRPWLTTVGAGEATVSLSGQADGAPDCPTAPEATTFDVEVDLPILVAAPTGMVFGTSEYCGDPDRWTVVTGQRSSWGRVRPVVDGHDVWLFANALPDAQVELRVTAQDGGTAEVWTERMLYELVFDGAAGVARIDGPGGDGVDVDVVTPSALTRADIVYEVRRGTGQGIVLEDGGTYGGDDAGDMYPRVLPLVEGVYVDETAICSWPSQDWFALEVATPDTCTAVDHILKVGLLATGKSVDLDADGVCDMTVRARDFGSGAGFEVGVAATFENTAAMLGQ